MALNWGVCQMFPPGEIRVLCFWQDAGTARQCLRHLVTSRHEARGSDFDALALAASAPFPDSSQVTALLSVPRHGSGEVF